MDKFQEKLADLKCLIDADDRISVSIDVDLNENEHLDFTQAETQKKMLSHETLKQQVVTRWNSTLKMISSMLSLWNEMHKALKRNGDREFSLTENDKTVLKELEQFLTTFKELTDLVSSEAPHLGLIPFIVREVNDATNPSPNDTDEIKFLKSSIRNNPGMVTRISVSR